MRLMQRSSNPQYYVESVEELDNIPTNVPAGTIAIVNAEIGVRRYMKTEEGTWNDAGSFSGGGDDPTQPLYPRG